MKDSELNKRLAKYGLPMFETEDLKGFNSILSDVVKSRDSRLWEAFPALLAKGCENGYYNSSLVLKGLKTQRDRESYEKLTAISLALFTATNVREKWLKAIGSGNDLPVKMKTLYEKYLDSFQKRLEIEIDGKRISSEKVKKIFENYHGTTDQGLTSFVSSKQEMDLEFALSQIFSPKQKELFIKRLKGEALNKTEREYFSRSVKKKILALANEDLHRLSQKLLD